MEVKIDLLTITKKTSTNVDGDVFYQFLIDNALENVVIVKIPNDVVLSSSFLNSSVGRFIDIFGIDKFKSNLRISSNKNIYLQLKKYVDYYSDLVK